MNITRQIRSAAEALSIARSGTNNKALVEFLREFLGAIAERVKSLSGEEKDLVQRDLEEVRNLFIPPRVVGKLASAPQTYEEFKRSATYIEIQEHMRQNSLFSDTNFNSSFGGSLPQGQTRTINQIKNFLKANELDNDSVELLAAKLSFRIHSGNLVPVISNKDGESPSGIGPQAYFTLMALIENAVRLSDGKLAALEIRIDS